jgi:hypothetical protein
MVTPFLVLVERLKQNTYFNRVMSVLWRCRLDLQAIFSSRRIRGAHHVVWIAPHDVQYAATSSVVRPARWLRLTVGLILGGDWDKERTPIAEMDIFYSLQMRYRRKWRWEDTPLYSRGVRQIRSGTKKWGCTTVEAFGKRLEFLDALMRSMEADGYRTERELTGRSWHEIIVCFGRHGEAMLVDGRHRLCIAKILQLPRIPVLVNVQHSDWLSSDSCPSQSPLYQHE